MLWLFTDIFEADASNLRIIKNEQEGVIRYTVDATTPALGKILGKACSLACFSPHYPIVCYSVRFKL